MVFNWLFEPGAQLISIEVDYLGQIFTLTRIEHTEVIAHFNSKHANQVVGSFILDVDNCAACQLPIEIDS